MGQRFPLGGLGKQPPLARRKRRKADSVAAQAGNLSADIRPTLRKAGVQAKTNTHWSPLVCHENVLLPSLTTNTSDNSAGYADY